MICGRKPALQNASKRQKWKDSPNALQRGPRGAVEYTSSMTSHRPSRTRRTKWWSTPAPVLVRPGTETDQIIGESFSDLFTSSRDRLGKWSEPVKLPISINTAGNEGAPIFNEKRNLMYFTRCPMEKKKVYRL